MPVARAHSPGGNHSLTRRMARTHTAAAPSPTSIRAVMLAANVALSAKATTPRVDRKSTRLNSSHGYISYAVFCLKKKKYSDTIERPHVCTPVTAIYRVLSLADQRIGLIRRGARNTLAHDACRPMRECLEITQVSD